MKNYLPLAYIIVHQNYINSCRNGCLPTIRSLRNWLQLLDVSCRLTSNLREILKTKFKSVEAKDKLVSINIDEMSIKKFVSYKSKNDLFSDFEDFEDNSIIDLKSIKYCDQALVVMIKGLTTT